MSEIPIGSEVELAPGYDHLYNPDPFQGKFEGAFVGAKAYVRNRRDDELGFPEVLIEWKKDDWRYAGISDGWTFENHFRPTKAQTAPKSLLEMVASAEQSRVCPHCGEVHDPEAEQMAEYIEELQEANEVALGSDAFIVVTIKAIGEEGNEVHFDGSIFHAEMSSEAREALEQQILHMAAHLTLNRRHK